MQICYVMYKKTTKRKKETWDIVKIIIPESLSKHKINRKQIKQKKQGGNFVDLLCANFPPQERENSFSL